MSLRRSVTIEKRGERHTLVSPTLEQLMIISRSEMSPLSLTAHLSYYLLWVQKHYCRFKSTAVRSTHNVRDIVQSLIISPCTSFTHTRCRHFTLSAKGRFLGATQQHILGPYIRTWRNPVLTLNSDYTTRSNATRQYMYKRNVEERSCNQCCCGKAITYSECVSVTPKNAKHTRLITVSFLACPALPYFSTFFLINGTTSVRKLLKIKCLFWFSTEFRGPPWRGGPRKSSPGPQHSVNTEINAVARTRAKRKAGYFFVAHPVFNSCVYHFSLYEEFSQILSQMYIYLLTYSMEQSPSWEANWFCS